MLIGIEIVKVLPTCCGGSNRDCLFRLLPICCGGSNRERSGFCLACCGDSNRDGSGCCLPVVVLI